MDSENLTEPKPPAPQSPKPRHRPVAVVSSMAIVFAFTAWGATWLIQSSAATITASVPVLVLSGAAVMLLLIGAGAHDLFYWRQPVRKFSHLLNELQQGLLPIEAMDEIPISMRPLGDPIRKLLVQWKACQVQVDEMNNEMRQRVASRTEAIERQLGVMRTKAARDALTGLSNRRSLDDELGGIVEANRKLGKNLVLMMVDVDHFKVLNDTLGHQAGDELLRAIGQLIRSAIRETDSAYRYGGDEFVLLLPGADRASANELGNRLKLLVDGLTKHHRNLNPRPQLSMGVCSLEEVPPTTEPSQILAWADQKLYAIKHARGKKSRTAA